ncbi:MAG: hypothetical protein QM621_13725 [Aeromicrobium sp.]|uniref:hypothetical protein n=1 Tax=Aeromicrobium sp. TaxID=1871063 RepID=UPI0039E5602B
MRIMRRVFWPSLAVAVVVCVLAAVLGGREGFWGALVGGVLVLAFLGSSPGLLEPVAKAHPSASLPVALVFFTVKAVIAIVLLLLLLDPDGLGAHVEARGLAAAMVVVALAWVALYTLAFRRSRTLLYDLDET